LAIRKAYSIGFTKRRAEEFFEALTEAGVRRLIDVRLNNSSQLAGFTKREDLPYFLREICHAEYLHETLLAPTRVLLDDYRKRRIDWQEYERRFLQLMMERSVESVIDHDMFDAPTVLLCTEPQADRCHRRLVLEHLQKRWGDLEVIHL
jgi:uncharacterized protein (DUF488 family)